LRGALEGGPAPGGAHLFLDVRDVAESAAGGVAIGEFFRFKIEMGAEFAVEVVFFAAHSASLTGDMTRAMAVASWFHLDCSTASCLRPAGGRREYLNSR